MHGWRAPCFAAGMRSSPLLLLAGILLRATPGLAETVDNFTSIPERSVVESAATSVPVHAPPETTISPLFATGVVVTGLSYLGALFITGAAVGAPHNCGKAAWMLLPLAGPIITYSVFRNAEDGPCRDDEGIAGSLVAVDGLAQGLGASLMLLGLPVVRPAPASQPSARAADNSALRWRIAPLRLDRSGATIGLVASF
jgi:hypothetical protein